MINRCAFPQSCLWKHLQGLVTLAVLELAVPVASHSLAHAAGSLSFIPANQFVGLRVNWIE